MKILDTSLIVDPGTQQPFTGPSLQFVEDSYKEALAALAKIKILDANRVTVLYGCLNSTPGTTTYTLTAGALYYNGEIYLVPAATLTTSGNAVIANLVDTNTLGNQMFSDEIARTTSHDRTAVWALGVSGAGTLSSDANSDFLEVDGIWKIVGDTSQPAFQNSWNYNTNLAKFRVDASGFVCMEGIILGGANASVAFTLPTRYRPYASKRFRACSFVVADSTVITIATSGTVTIEYTGGAGTTSVHLDSVRFAVD